MFILKKEVLIILEQKKLSVIKIRELQIEGWGDKHMLIEGIIYIDGGKSYKQSDISYTKKREIIYVKKRAQI